MLGRKSLLNGMSASCRRFGPPRRVSPQADPSAELQIRPGACSKNGEAVSEIYTRRGYRSCLIAGTCRLSLALRARVSRLKVSKRQCSSCHYFHSTIVQRNGPSQQLLTDRLDLKSQRRALLLFVALRSFNFHALCSTL